MKNPSLCRIGALAALALLSAWPSYAEDRAVRTPEGGLCASYYVDCGPGARFSYQSCACVPEFNERNYCPAVECGRGSSMNRATCRCMPDDFRGFHGYEKSGPDLRDSVNSAPASGAFSGLGQQVGAISAAMGNQDMSKAAEGLNGLFSGSGSKKDSSGSAPVVAGDWKVSPRLELAMSQAQAPRRQDVPAGLLALRSDAQTQGAKFVTAGLSSEVLEEALRRAEAAARAAEEALRRNAERDQTEESKEKYGGCRMKGTCEK